MPVLTPQERIGTVLDGKYRLDRILGEGGFGVVFGATHVGLSRPVAVKLLHDGLADQAEVVSRFLREARATSTLEHPNVIDVRDVVTSPENGVYMVLELLEGETLAKLLERKPVLDLEETMRYLGPILDAMCAAHAAGIVHRDIKPDNVFLSRTPDGQIVPKLLDFGIAKLADAGAGMATQTGMVLGTPIYMAPEQAMGRTKEIGALSDVWSMAVMIYECLTGRFPFELPHEPSPTAVVLEVITGRIVPIAERRPDLPPAVNDVIARALDRTLSTRLGSMRELYETLTRAQAEVRTVPPPASAPAGQFPATLYATGTASGLPATTAPAGLVRPASAAAPHVPATVLATGDLVVPAQAPGRRTGPIPGSPLLDTHASLPSPSTSVAATTSGALTTTGQMFAHLAGPTQVPTWVWAAGAVAALLGTMAALALTLHLGADEEAAPPPVPAREPPPLVVAPPPPEPPAPPVAPVAAPAVAPTVAPEPAPPVLAVEPAPAHSEPSRDRPRGSRDVGRPLAATTPPPPAVAPAPPPVRPPPPPPEPEPERPGVVHRAGEVSLDDF